MNVRPERFSGSRTSRTNERTPAASDIRRGDLKHEAKDQSFRYRKDLGLPNQVCLFRRDQVSTAIAEHTTRFSGSCDDTILDNRPLPAQPSALRSALLLPNRHDLLFDPATGSVSLKVA